MSSGDEPQLGGQDRDDAPMISGRGTKIIVSARGAYLAGNLRRLVERLDDAQLRAFRVAIVQHELWRTNQILQSPYYSSNRLSPQTLECVAALNRLIPAVQEWLSNPTLEQAQRLLSATELQLGIDQVVRINFGKIKYFHDLEDVFFCLLWCMEYEPEGESFAHRIAMFPNIWSVKRWRLEAAWAILNHRMPPAFETFTPDAPLGDYRSGSLSKLLAHMTGEQQIVYRKAIVQHLLRYLPAMQLPDRVVPAWEALCQSIAQWLDQPDDTHAKRVSKAVASVKRVTYRRTLFNLFQQPPIAEERTMEIAEAAGKTILLPLEETARPARMIVLFSRGYDEDHWKFDTDTTWWHLEAAWAILNDQPLPPVTLLESPDVSG